MFHSARLKLTGWYLLIIMVISLSFSAVIYRMLTVEVDRLLLRQNIRLQQQFDARDLYPSELRNGPFALPLIDPELVEEMKARLIGNLAIINGLILFGAGGLSFVLAGKALRPIKVMIDEQNRFIADASHELRTPITALKTTLEVSLRDDYLSLTEARETLKANLADVNRLHSLSNGLLELAQYQRRPQRNQQESAALTPAIKAAIKVVLPLAHAKKITINLNPFDDANVAITTKQLTDILISLLDNAIKYSLPKTAITVQTSQKDSHVHIKITDQGIGIAATDLPHIFDRFYQVESSRSSEERNGYGLGLAIAKQTAEQHQGSITVTSTVGHGTSFTLNLRKF